MKSIIVVEDDPLSQKLLTKKLKNEGYNVISISSGKLALQKIKSIKVDLVLLDVMLEGDMNGFELLQKIRSLKTYKDIPVIMLTNYGEKEMYAKSLGATEYMIKANNSMDNIITKIRSVSKLNLN